MMKKQLVRNRVPRGESDRPLKNAMGASRFLFRHCDVPRYVLIRKICALFMSTLFRSLREPAFFKGFLMAAGSQKSRSGDAQNDHLRDGDDHVGRVLLFGICGDQNKIADDGH